MKILFHKYTEQDKSDILRMMRDFTAIDNYPFDRITREENLEEFSSNELLGRLYLIQKDDRNIGYIVLSFGFSFEYRGRDAFIDEFYIDEQFRNQGIGKMNLNLLK
ncbi:MAG: GNAT family N-acetyltransferase [Cyclobacteriaceae bacterium]